jgi:hypothetical protein
MASSINAWLAHQVAALEPWFKGDDALAPAFFGEAKSNLVTQYKSQFLH